MTQKTDRTGQGEVTRAQHLKGFSLIELMISMAIGLIIVVASFSAYQGASQASKLAQAQGRMNEDAQAALAILTQQVGMAGHNPIQAGRTDAARRNPVYGPTAYTTGSYIPSDFALRGCDGPFSNVMTAARIDELRCEDGATGSIAVSYEADQFNTVPTDRLPTDCLGFELDKVTATFPAQDPSGEATSADYFVADNRFYIATAAPRATPSLYCKGNGQDSQARPLVENVEDLQFTYGAAADSSDIKTAPVAGYLSAQAIGQLPPQRTTVPADADRWGKVISVRVCVLVRSDAPVLADPASAQYYNCANPGTLVSAPDLRLRRAYSTTVVLRNRRL